MAKLKAAGRGGAAKDTVSTTPAASKKAPAAVAPDPFDYSDVVTAPAVGALEQIVTFAAVQVALQREVDRLTGELEIKTKELRQVEQVDLPEAMAQAGVQDFTLKTGEKITVKLDYIVNIAKAVETQAFDWLRKHNLDSIIKREVKAKFGKGDEKLAEKLLNTIKKHLPEAEVEDKKSVHPATLKATLKEQVDQGVVVPPELFGMLPMKKAIIKQDAKQAVL